MSDFPCLKVSGNVNDYKDFIRKVRNNLSEVEGVRHSRSLPILPPQEDIPTRWADVDLSTESCVITLRLRLDNLYLVGFRVNNQWYEFRPDRGSRHLISDSAFLSFGGSYMQLGDLRSETSLNRQALETAVNNLARNPTADSNRKWLTIVIQMICESVRFQRISNHLADTYYADDNTPLPWMLHLENGWGDVSEALLRVDADPMERFQNYLPQSNDLGIVTVEDATGQVAVILRRSLHCNINARYRRMVDDEYCVVTPRGLPMVEVFRVVINNIDGESPGDLYGTIKISDGLGCQDLYNRDRDNTESIKPGEFALLKGPQSRYISALGSFTINVDLWDKDEFSSDDEISRGAISWNVYSTTNEYDEPIEETIPGTYGSVSVNYVVISDALEATVEVTLINGDGEDPADVYGFISASNDKFSTKTQRILFNQKRDERIEVRPYERISRSVVAVPVDSTLIVWADLWDRDDYISSDDQIAKGSAEFPAKFSDTKTKRITGKYGEIEVKVTFA